MTAYKITMASRSIDGLRYTIVFPSDNECSCARYLRTNTDDVVLDIKEIEENGQDSNVKFCPFSFDNGKMHSCQKDKCMAYRHIIDGSGEYVAEYCKLIDRKEK